MTTDDPENKLSKLCSYTLLWVKWKMLGRTILNVTVNTRIIVSNSQVHEKKIKKRRENEGKKTNKQTNKHTNKQTDKQTNANYG